MKSRPAWPTCWPASASSGCGWSTRTSDRCRRTVASCNSWRPARTPPPCGGRLATCAGAFGTEPAEGTTTYLSRGTDEDALGVLLAFGVAGDLSRASGADGWDVVTVRLAEADLRRVPESRIQTALEASLNCEVRIVAT